MTTSNVNHVTGQIDAYVAGGLNDADRQAVEAHVAGCLVCAAAMDAARSADARLSDLFAAARPADGFEDRLVGRLRLGFGGWAGRPRWVGPILHPLVRRVATGVAAALVVGTVGYGMNRAIEEQREQATAAPVSRPAAAATESFGEERDVPSVTEPGDRLVDLLKQGLSNRQSGGAGANTSRWHVADLAKSDSDGDGTGARPGFQGTTPDADLDTPAEIRLRTRELLLQGQVGRFGQPDDEGKFDAAGARAPAPPGPAVRSPKSAAAGVKNAPNALRDGGTDVGESEVRREPAAGGGAEPAVRQVEGRPQASGQGPANEDRYGRSLGRHAGTGVASAGEFFVSPKARPQVAAGAASGLYAETQSDRRTVPPPAQLPEAAKSAAAGVAGASTDGGKDASSYNLGSISQGGEAGGKGGPGLSGAAIEGTVERGAAVSGERKLLEAPQLPPAGWFKPADAVGKKVAEEAQKNLKDVAGGKPGQAGQQGVQELEKKRQQQQAAPQQQLQQMQQLAGGQSARSAPRIDVAARAAPGADATPPASGQPAAAAPAAAAPAAADPVAQQQVQPQQARKIIRNGSLSFEVDGFDSAMLQVGKIAGEEGGFVATTDSEKLPNGKVRGSVTVRCPPDRLDTLVLKLRGLGDLKNQRIVAQDVTKKFVDTESQLRAGRAMEERLLAIIKAGGTVKDLLEAEKQLGVWREKLEVLEGEIRYMNAQIALSTLVVELMERDVRTPTAASETETVSAGIETDDVEKARTEALAAIDQAKGRVVDSDLKQLEGGQLSATIVADVAPDAAGPVIDRLKQLGRVARLDVSRKTTTAGGVGPIAPGLRVERKETRFQLNLYNLANIAPRQSTSLNLAAADVEATYRAILDQVKSAGGRVVGSQLNRPKADQTVGTVTFEAPADKADLLLGAVRAGGVEVMRMEVTTNPDAQNTTDAKWGFSVQVYSLAHVPAREQTALQVAARDVPAAFNKLLDAAKAAGGRVLTSTLNEQDANNVSGSLDFEVRRDQWPPVDAALREAGLLVTRNVTRSPDAEGTVDSKVRLSLSLIDELRLAPRETVAARVAVRDVPGAFAALAAVARETGARVVGSNLNANDRTNPNGSLAFAVPREAAGRVEAAVREAGLLVSRAVNRQPDGSMNVETKVGFAVEVVDERSLVPRESHAMTVVAPKVTDRYAKLLDDLRLLDAQVTRSQLTVQNKNDITGELDFVVRRDDRPTVEKALADGADVFNRTVARSQDVKNTVDTKVRFSVILKDADQQPARQNYTLAAETADVEKAVGDVEAAAVAAGGRKLDSTRTSVRGEDVARVVVDVPLARAGDVVNAVRSQGRVTVTQTSRNDAVPEGGLSRARVEVTFGSPGTVRAEQGFGDTIRAGLNTALTGLAISLRYIIVGLLVVVPWVLVLWVAVRLVRRGRRRAAAADAAADAAVPPATPNVPGPGPSATPA